VTGFVAQVGRPAPPYLGRAFPEFSLGERFGVTVGITERHLAQAAELTGDFNPLHVDDEFARPSRYGGCILHGVATAALMSAPFGNLVAGTAIAYLEQAARFIAPVRAGDTLEIVWRVVELLPKPAHGGGIVVAECETRNQRGEIVATARGKMLVSNQRPAS
jgi:3-hydroxybutyryl-CoA dehydratase